jgi:hypothetical protein
MKNTKNHSARADQCIKSEIVEIGATSLDLIHKYTNSQLIFDLVKVAAKTQTHFLKDLLSSIIN